MLELQNLPDEILLKVLNYLEIEEVCICVQVSQRFRDICHDQTLWNRVNLFGNSVLLKFLEMILNKKCKYLSLLNATLVVWLQELHGAFKCSILFM